MKIVFHNGSRTWSGNENMLALLAEGLRDREHLVMISCVGGSVVEQRLRSRGFRTSRIRPRGDLDLLSAIRFGRWLGRIQPDALLLTSWKRMPVGAWVSKQAGVPRVVARLGIRHTLPKSGLKRLALLRYVDRYIANSHEVRSALLESAPALSPDQVFLVPNGVPPIPPATNDFREELHVGPDTRLILGAGRVEYRKGFDLLIRAFAELHKSDVRLVIAGDDSNSQNERVLTRNLGVEDRIHWLGHRDDFYDVLRGCDVFVLSSRKDSTPSVMLEALSVGISVVATAVDGVPAALAATEGRPAAGRIVPAEDVPALAEAIQRTLAELGQAGSRTEAARAEGIERVRSRFTVPRMVEEVEKVLFD